MFDPISLLIGGALCAMAIYTIVHYAYLTWSTIVNWFRENEDLATEPNNVAATIKTKLDSGEHAVVQGIFNRRTGEEVEARTITYDELDSEIRDAHRRDEVVIWE